MSQWGNMAELQIDKVAIREDILIGQNVSGGTEQDLGEFYRQLLNEIEGRWEPSREEDADISKRPLIRYAEWRVIEAGYNEEERNEVT